MILCNFTAALYSIHSMKALPVMLTKFSEELWGALADHLTVYGKDKIVFTLTSGAEIRV